MFGIIVLIVILVVIAGFVLSKFYTIDQAGFSDKQGILSNFDSEKYSQEDTFRTEGMENWKIWDVLMWIFKNGQYQPAT